MNLARRRLSGAIARARVRGIRVLCGLGRGKEAWRVWAAVVGRNAYAWDGSGATGFGYMIGRWRGPR